MKEKNSIFGVLLVSLLAIFVMACNDANIIPIDVVPEFTIAEEELVDWKAIPNTNIGVDKTTIKTAVKSEGSGEEENHYLELSLNFSSQGTAPQVEFYADFDDPVDVSDYVGIYFKTKYETGMPFEFFFSERIGDAGTGEANYTGKATVKMIYTEADISGGNTETWQEFTWNFEAPQVQNWNAPVNTDWGVIKTQVNKILFLIGCGENDRGAYTMLFDDIGFIKADGKKVIYANFEEEEE